MLVERRYPLSKDLLKRMLDLGLEVERETKAVDEDGKCLKIISRCVKVFGYILQELKKINLKKHEVKQVQQSCLGEDCWELFIPDLVPLETSGEDSDQKNDSDDDNTQSDNENESNSKHETDENKSGSESDQEKNKEDEDDEEEVKDELVKTPSNDFDDENKTKFTDKAEGDGDEEMDYTTSQLYDDVDIRLNELGDSDKGFVQKEGTDAAMTNVQQGNENPEILQVIEDAHVTLSTVPQKTKVPVTSYFHSSELAVKFLNFSDIPYTDAEIVSPMDVHVHHEVPSQQTPILLIVPVSVIFDSSPVFFTVISQSLPSFTSPPQQSTSTPPPTIEATNPLSTLPDFTSVF
ncbi:hypothetical protein Tco_0517168 [Tanacetum coccineum]